jgi:hypothetical protein
MKNITKNDDAFLFAKKGNMGYIVGTQDLRSFYFYY